MHEMSVAMSLLTLAEETAAGQGCTRLMRVRVEYGALAGIMPEALELCFEALTRGTAHEGAALELVCLPLRLRCVFCGTVFGGEGQEARFTPCPGCGEVAGHVVEQGKELLLREVEAS
ncbi:MAG: hydrogenase maturation nickel metallochaperone HypA [Desulfovibrio sp.]|uniref:hydrogenase maturation nickel metallochaperone HypA/HybF n=1 Tax=Desulfovibrio sp. TaxID=885 RepID=UPI001A76BFBA|nr:hydrogenase maturation nickel metallochaperone HypA [Desulfovibrio sp.]MBD5416605.1 hydrogenase maturation nickel metallochaperone HypA [Desulfovibrio sp.]